jgi:hypothetical protein
MPRGMTGLFTACAALLGPGCGDNTATTADAAVDAPVAGTLLETGLCMDAECTTFSSAVTEYEPRFQLWADTSSKRRWIQLPAGTQIDTTDMNHWVFPMGTKFWKEFTRGTTRVETRYITKLMADDNAPGAWLYASYEWNGTQDAAVLASPQMGVMNANGTAHDIPSRSQCKECHDALKPSRVLGFGAVQLDYAAATGLLDLEDLIAMNVLSAPPVAGSFALPADTTEAPAALGYLHANCGHCHNPTSPTHDVTPLDLRLDVTKLGTVDVTPTYLTTVNVNGTVGGLTGKIIKPKDPGMSVMIERMNATTYPTKMPQLGTEDIDPVGQTALTAWIGSL